MYIFRIVSPIDKNKAWYLGEFITPTALDSVSVTNPPDYPVEGISALNVGDMVESDGYIYSSLKNDNTDYPGLNYLGYPTPQLNPLDPWGQNSWIRSGYANKVLMLVPESCGITESYDAGITGSIVYPTEIPYVDIDKCVCILLCGVLGNSITVNSKVITGIDVNDYETAIGNPETSSLNTAFTMSTELSGSIFTFSIDKSPNSVSTYCSGAYLGSWSYLGITQWTNHKKSTNDYSRQEQDTWGNYSLSKNRTGRTYSAEVILKPRENALLGDYDYNLKDLCYSVLNLLQSQLGVVNAFYFNNQDIGVPWIPHNQSQENELIQLNDSDIIVGILKNCRITDMTGNRALLSLTVDSVPNEYKNYTTILEELPETAPEVEGLIACSSFTSDIDGIPQEIDLGVTVSFPEGLVAVPTGGTYYINGITLQYSTPDICAVTVVETEGVYIEGLAVGTTIVTMTIPYWAVTNTVQNKIIVFTVTVI